MRICVYGAGAIGGLLAARLAEGGAEVSVVARGAHLAAIRADGLTIHKGQASSHTRPAASEHPGDLGEQDAVIVAVKAPALPAVAAGIAPLLGAATQVVFAMNGIPWWYFHGHGGPHDGRALPRLDPEGALLGAIGLGRTLGGVVNSFSEVTAPGVLTVGEAPGRLMLGAPDGADRPGAHAIAAALNAGGFPCEVVASIRDRVWTKLLGNVGSGPLAVLTGTPMLPLMEVPAMARVAESLMREIAAIARALGRDPGDPLASFPMLRNSTHRQSILQDFEARRPMEIDALYRIPLELAAEFAVPAPTLELFTHLVIARARSAGLYA